MRLPLRLLVVVTAAGATSTLLAGTATAVWTSLGTGTGKATAATGPVALTTTATVAAGSLLAPGGSAVALSVKVDNANGVAIQVTGVALDTARAIGVTGAKGTCTNPALSVSTPGGWTGLAIPANGTTGATTIAGAVSMGVGADSGCQGATFTIPVTLTGHS